mmetsp:Transcript_3316/g.5524  ORF Transcript_3316/g.5524 Transcript_3316/m.5524 type:complete len:201 (-) Transcript_3316:156-758(-)|eukprot:CAMPEP_0184990586 /NCGR_PEP_ID=MMETSP1098-20130426/33060_1 /TAXON_ID=89044 /ORGANISM="Spumella elongata, Strain CCAP 955/1" /LENGTH=200 /DNA_ID=CAMNT_0027515819 /DNA_START=94 /DNA_END=696 /DNA_ORIENTATION=-
MRTNYFRKALIFAPALFSLNGIYVTTSVALLMLPTAHCIGSSLPRDGKDKKEKEKEEENDFFKKFADKLPHQLREDLGGIMGPAGVRLKSVFESGVPAQVGYGFMMGYSSGFCLKKVSKMLAFGLGGIFIVVQAMSYNGYINVNYGGIQKDIENLLDLNKDGKVDAKDVEHGMNKIQDMLEYNMPSGGGFTTGLILGLRG